MEFAGAVVTLMNFDCFLIAAAVVDVVAVVVDLLDSCCCRSCYHLY